MVNTCHKCGKVFNHGDKVEMMVEGDYMLIPSTKTFALNKASLKYIPETLSHIECTEDECLS